MLTSSFRRLAGLLGATLALAGGAVAAAQITSHDGHARLRAAATIDRGAALVTLDCPRSQVPCGGRWVLRTKDSAVVARGRFGPMEAGSSAERSGRLTAAGRRLARRSRRLELLGFAHNELPGGDVQTVQPVRVVVRRAR